MGKENKQIPCQVQATDTHDSDSVQVPVLGAVGTINTKRSFHGELLLEETGPSSPRRWYHPTPQLRQASWRGVLKVEPWVALELDLRQCFFPLGLPNHLRYMGSAGDAEDWPCRLRERKPEKEKLHLADVVGVPTVCRARGSRQELRTTEEGGPARDLQELTV